jgi:hypothetical protein
MQNFKETCEVLGGGNKTIDEKNSKNILRYINARLKEEFGISIKRKNRKNKSCNKYILDNPYIDNNIFELEENDMNIPVLGKSLDKKRDDDHYKKFINCNADEPYDSDDEY